MDSTATGDAGGALGAALSVWYSYYNCGRKVSTERDAMGGSYLGPEYSNEEIEAELKSSGAVYRKLSDENLFEEVASALVNENAIGWMQGRMEFGPRALGGRSIIADPRSPIMQTTGISR